MLVAALEPVLAIPEEREVIVRKPLDEFAGLDLLVAGNARHAGQHFLPDLSCAVPHRRPVCDGEPHVLKRTQDPATQRFEPCRVARSATPRGVARTPACRHRQPDLRAASMRPRASRVTRRTGEPSTGRRVPRRSAPSRANRPGTACRRRRPRRSCSASCQPSTSSRGLNTRTRGSPARRTQPEFQMTAPRQRRTAPARETAGLPRRRRDSTVARIRPATPANSAPSTLREHFAIASIKCCLAAGIVPDMGVGPWLFVALAVVRGASTAGARRVRRGGLRSRPAGS